MRTPIGKIKNKFHKSLELSSSLFGPFIDNLYAITESAFCEFLEFGLSFCRC